MLRRVAQLTVRVSFLVSVIAFASDSNETVPGVANKLWVLYDYPAKGGRAAGPGPLAELNMDTWRKHAPELSIVFVNDTNIREFVPDVPEEFFQLYDCAKSDFVRAALLYHHGGVYMDVDFLLNGNLSDVYDKLREHDIVTYSTDQKPSGDCGTHFSSNFMAGRKGNLFSKTWYDNIRKKLVRECELDEFHYEKVCCHAKGDPPGFQRKCHIPFAQLEHMKVPQFFDDSHVNPVPGYKKPSAPAEKKNSVSFLQVRASAPAKRSTDMILWPDNLRLFCYHGAESLAAHINGEMYWQPWDSDSQRTAENSTVHADARRYEQRFQCELQDKNVQCSRGNWNSEKRTFANFFDRKAYHLFFHTRAMRVESKEEALHADWLVSEMWRRSLGVQRKV